MKLKKDDKKAKYILKEKKEIVKKQDINSENSKKEKNNIIEELYKEKLETNINTEKIPTKKIVNIVIEKNNSEKTRLNKYIEEDDGIGNLEKKLCYQYEQEILEEENNSNNIKLDSLENNEINSKIKDNKLEINEVEKNNNLENSNNIEENKIEEIIDEKNNVIENNSNQEERNVDKDLDENIEKEIISKYKSENENNTSNDEDGQVRNTENKQNEIKTKLKENKILNKIISIYKAIFSHPEDVEKSFSTWFDSNKKFAFLTALIVGVLTHITFITDMIMSPDGLWNSICYFEADNWEASLGRWGLFIANKIVNNLALPNLTGIIAIVLIAISATFIVDILKMKNKITIFIVSVAMVVSPALTGTLLYMYTSVAYCFISL